MVRGSRTIFLIDNFGLCDTNWSRD